MKFLIQLVISTLAVLISTYLLSPHISIQDNSFVTALIVAAVLAFLNTILKPIMIILTIPVTIISLGFFLLVINASMIMLAGKIVTGFHVQGFWWALLFSFILSFVTSLLDRIKRNDERGGNI